MLNFRTSCGAGQHSSDRSAIQRTVRDQIEHYLEKARIEKIEASQRQVWDEVRTQSTALMRLDGAHSRRLTAGDVCTLANGVGARAHKLGLCTRRIVGALPAGPSWTFRG